MSRPKSHFAVLENCFPGVFVGLSSSTTVSSMTNWSPAGTIGNRSKVSWPPTFEKVWGTGAPLPSEKIETLQRSRTFLSGLAMVRQLEFALFDFRLHEEYSPERGSRVREVLDEVRREVAVVEPPPFNRFAHSFGHVFGGGYAAGYYSYKWAEVLAADAFAAFEEAGVFDRATAERFRRAVLATGGSRKALDAFIDFRGRQPKLDALLKQSGIAERQ